ncbi:MAG: Unknown protein [uncultured Sulfurovum sp.]|uniref:Lipoprotein n=1 Tax=uncultured Sulfurovum sp. TaxID=269237 RepID=A0A6S6SAH8_9BACT|nr:MAG: Unknown protein [uncultured Sulfurovum sp.]
MKFFIGVVMAMMLFTGCTTTEPKVPTVKSNSSVTEANQTEVPIESNVSSIEESSIDDENVILNVFNDELYFEKDKVGKDKRQVVIKYLDAHKWEKKALSKIYKKYKQLWSKKQSKDFFKILEEDKYLSLCSDRRYWDNLQFEENQPERDVLHSILLIRYLNNLSHGCPKWVESNAKIKDENAKEYIRTKHLLSLLPHNVIIPKLIESYQPKSKKFRKFMKKQKRLLELDTEGDVLKASRLELEKHKRKLCEPKYKNRK